MEKTCLACNVSKPLTEFHTDRSRKDSLNVYCKPCTRAKVREYATHAPRHPTPEGARRCQICKETKPEAEFYAAKSNVGRLSKRCKVCSKRMITEWRAKNPERHRASSKKWADKNPSLKRETALQAKYGISIAEYNAMLKEQNGRCAICEADTSNKLAHRLHVDHEHETGKVRGLLCTNCNTGIGQFKHREVLLQEAIKYLQVLPKGRIES